MILNIYDSKNQQGSRTVTSTDDTRHYAFGTVDAPTISLSVNNGGTIPNKQTFTTKKETPEALVIDITIQ